MLSIPEVGEWGRGSAIVEVGRGHRRLPVCRPPVSDLLVCGISHSLDSLASGSGGQDSAEEQSCLSWTLLVPTRCSCLQFCLVLFAFVVVCFLFFLAALLLRKRLLFVTTWSPSLAFMTSALSLFVAFNWVMKDHFYQWVDFSISQINRSPQSLTGNFCLAQVLICADLVLIFDFSSLVAKYSNIGLYRTSSKISNLKPQLKSSQFCSSMSALYKYSSKVLAILQARNTAVAEYYFHFKLNATKISRSW